MPKCLITQSGNDYAVKTPFSRAFVDDLKQAVSVKARHFDGESKAWIVSPEYAEFLRPPNVPFQIVADGPDLFGTESQFVQRLEVHPLLGLTVSQLAFDENGIEKSVQTKLVDLVPLFVGLSVGHQGQGYVPGFEIG